MTNVASLDARRASSSDVVRRCVCGSEWFRLIGMDGEMPAVTMDTDGSVTGYAGSVVCEDCARAQ